MGVSRTAKTNRKRNNTYKKKSFKFKVTALLVRLKLHANKFGASSEAV